MTDPCFVYVISIPSMGLSKIGISSQPAGRLAQLATGSPFPMVLVQMLSFDSREDALNVERTFHEVLAGKRKSGEWFDLSPSYAQLLLCISVIAFCRHKEKLCDEAIPDALAEHGVPEAVLSEIVSRGLIEARAEA